MKKFSQSLKIQPNLTDRKSYDGRVAVKSKRSQTKAIKQPSTFQPTTKATRSDKTDAGKSTNGFRNPDYRESNDKYAALLMWKRQDAQRKS